MTNLPFVSHRIVNKNLTTTILSRVNKYMWWAAVLLLCCACISPIYATVEYANLLYDWLRHDYTIYFLDLWTNEHTAAIRAGKICANDGWQFISFSMTEAETKKREKNENCFRISFSLTLNLHHNFFYSLNSPPSLTAIKVTLAKIYDWIDGRLNIWTQQFSRFYFYSCVRSRACGIMSSRWLSDDCMHIWCDANPWVSATLNVRTFYVSISRFRSFFFRIYFISQSNEFVRFVGQIYVDESRERERHDTKIIFYSQEHTLIANGDREIQILLLSSCRPNYATIIYGQLHLIRNFFMPPMSRSLYVFLTLCHWLIVVARDTLYANWMNWIYAESKINK